MPAAASSAFPSLFIAFAFALLFAICTVTHQFSATCLACLFDLVWFGLVWLMLRLFGAGACVGVFACFRGCFSRRCARGIHSGPRISAAARLLVQVALRQAPARVSANSPILMSKRTMSQTQGPATVQEQDSASHGDSAEITDPLHYLKRNPQCAEHNKIDLRNFDKHVDVGTLKKLLRRNGLVRVRCGRWAESGRCRSCLSLRFSHWFTVSCLCFFSFVRVLMFDCYLCRRLLVSRRQSLVMWRTFHLPLQKTSRRPSTPLMGSSSSKF